MDLIIVEFFHIHHSENIVFLKYSVSARGSLLSIPLKTPDSVATIINMYLRPVPLMPNFELLSSYLVGLGIA